MTSTLKCRLIGYLSVLKPKSGPGNAFQDRSFAPEVRSSSVRQTIVTALASTISVAQRMRRGAQSAIADEKALDGDGGRLEVVGINVNICTAAL